LFLQKVKHKLINICLNNVIVNNLIMIPLGKDNFIINRNYKWESLKYDNNKTLQENVGYSHAPAIQESRDKMAAELSQLTESKLQTNAKVLDIGCGTGLFLKAINPNKKKYGIDLNAEFLEKALQQNPGATLFQGNYLKHDFNEKFDFIYSIGVFMFVVPSTLDDFFKKTADLLNPGGYIYVQYPQALSMSDVIYHDISYMRHAPIRIENVVGKYFNVISNKHAYKDEKVKYYDTNPYYFPGDASKSKDSNQNTYVIIAQKK
jgi:SAM-dependent methyltransferase